MADFVTAADIPRIPVHDSTGAILGDFPVRRIYCVGRNFADHAREMGADAPASKDTRGAPVFFCKPADALVIDGNVPYTAGTSNLHHEDALVVALGSVAPLGALAMEDAMRLGSGSVVGGA